MLGEHPITPVLLATDLAADREFYHGKLGLQIVREDQNVIVFSCDSSTHLDMTESIIGTAGQQTQAAWQVRDIRAEVAELRARSIKVEDYGTPGQRPKSWRTSRAGLAKLLARRSTSPSGSGSVNGRYLRTGGDTGVGVGQHACHDRCQGSWPGQGVL
jgi:hypothetical protein